MKKYIASLFSLLLLVTVVPHVSAMSLEAHMVGGKVTAKSGTTLTVTKDTKTVTVNTDANTRIVRRYNGKSALSEISVGDFINFAGVWIDSSKTVAYAKLIRDGSIQERHDTFTGTVTSVTNTGFVLATTSRGTQTVEVLSNTKIVDRENNTLPQANILVNDKVQADGMWDRTLSTISADSVRDQSQPMISGTPTTNRGVRRTNY
jgi:hypothetical protein